jgi:hypothetical protein
MENKKKKKKRKERRKKYTPGKVNNHQPSSRQPATNASHEMMTTRNQTD